MEIGRKSKGEAIVIGSSIAGLLGAAAMAPYFSRVTVVDVARSEGSEAAEKQAPQGHHAHSLLSSGWMAIQTLLPGVEGRLQQQGVDWVDYGKELSWHHFGKFKANFEEPMVGPFMSRGCLEKAIFEEVATLENVEFRQGKVVGLVGDSSQLSGVLLATGEEMRAELVLDSSGRTSHCPQWLEGLGGRAPRLETLEAGLRYSSCKFKPTADLDRSWKVLVVIPKPPETMAGVIFPQEDGSWLVTLSGRKGDTMPTNNEEFIAYTRQLASLDLYHALREAEPLSELTHYRFKESRRYFYEKLKMPKNLLVSGDAVCSFNPIFGQGMSVCAIQSLKLAEMLGCGDCDSARYFKSISTVVQQAWDMITVEDTRHPDLHHHRSLKIKLMQKLTQRVYDKSAEDAQLNRLLYEVIHFRRPATDLCKPWALWRLL